MRNWMKIKEEKGRNKWIEEEDENGRGGKN